MEDIIRPLKLFADNQKETRKTVITFGFFKSIKFTLKFPYEFLFMI